MDKKSRGFGKGKHTLPDNPEWIEIGPTDGDQSRWPTNLDPTPDSSGEVNFMLPIPLDYSISIHWRRQLGVELAGLLGLPSGPAYVLKAWPAGYNFYDHHKGPARDPRHDAYLYGSTIAQRFRSPKEFAPHAFWLMTDAGLNSANCGCKYCSKTPQRVVSQSLPTSQARVDSPLPTPREKNKPRRSEKPPRPSVATGSSSEKEKPQLVYLRRKSRRQMQPGPSQYMDLSRERDLRAAINSKGMKTKRWAREGELVWCPISPAIPVKTEATEIERIEFWPGLVMETRLKTETILNRVNKDSSTALPHPDAPPGTQHDQEGERDPPWTIKQSTQCKVDLLGIEFEMLVSDEDLLPYQAHMPPTELIDAMQLAPVEFDNHNDSYRQTAEEALFKRLAAFRPMLSRVQASDLTSFYHEAAAAYAFAIQIAATIAGYWTPTDDWEVNISGSVKNAFGRGKENNVSLAPIDGNQRTPLSQLDTQGLRPQRSSVGGKGKEPEVHREPIQFTEKRYQGLWWGGERIWLDELVRFKPGRHQVAPNGHYEDRKGKSVELIRAPSCPDITDDIGSLGRGLFIKLQALFKVQIDTPDGPANECRASGMLYELADQDWEEKPEVQSSAGNGGGEVIPVDSGPGEIATEQGTTTTEGEMRGKKRSREDEEGDQERAAKRAKENQTMMDDLPFSNTTSDQDPAAVPSTASASNANPPPLAPTRSPPGPRPEDDNLRTPTPTLPGPFNSSNYPLPEPPIGYKFRPILPEGYEAVVPLTYLSGRYYPGILSHPLMNERVAAAIQDGLLRQAASMTALEGLCACVHNSMDPRFWNPSRKGMVVEAKNKARVMLFEHWWDRRHGLPAAESMEHEPLA